MEIVVPLNLNELHASQKDVLLNKKRFNILKIGRRWGKTELAKEIVIQAMLNGFPCGYWTPTYKDLFEVWNDLKHVLHNVISEKHESVKQIKLHTGGLIDFWSMDDPDSGRGRKYKVVIIDEAEKAGKFKEAWEQAISPTLIDYRGDAWILSTPKFGKTYFKELFDKAKTLSDWNYFNKSTYENPFIDPAELDGFRLRDDLTFRCEILAEDIDVTDKPFMYCFDETKHVSRSVILNPKDTVYLSFDFNVDPVTCIVAQIGADFIHVLDEYRLRNSDLYELCGQIKSGLYGKCHFIVTGDASGMARDVKTKGNINAYTIIMKELNVTSNQIKLPRMNPPISESRTLCNSILSRHPNIEISILCKYLIEDLKFVQVKEDGSIDKTSNTHRSHLLDTFRYLLNSFKHDYIVRN